MAGVGVASGKLLAWYDIVVLVVRRPLWRRRGGSGDEDSVRDGVLLVHSRSLGIVFILVVVLPGVQATRKSFQSYLGEVQDNLLMRLSWWDKHCDVHRGVSLLQDFQLVGCGIRGEERMVR